MFVYDNYFKLSKLRKHKKLTLFIDVVKMNNLYGHEYVYINNEYKKKNVNFKITILSYVYHFYSCILIILIKQIIMIF